jgi:phosphoribosyl-ATP pyrophosphohydrolase/phosphoribosyl-AMP cyclohydrolase
MKPTIDPNTLDFAKGHGLLPVIIQDDSTREVLMQAWMNREALEKTLLTGLATFYSRSKKRLWTKGETSGNHLEVRRISSDCDQDCLLLWVHPRGPACHTGRISCFRREEPGAGPAGGFEGQEASGTASGEGFAFLTKLQKVLRERAGSDPQTSYTARLLSAGPKRIAKKLGEEAVELALEAEHGTAERFREEAADLVYHLSVLLISKGMGWEDILVELERRHGG